MTEAAAPALVPELVHYVEIWAESLARVLGQIGGAPLPCAVLSEAQPELTPISEGDLWITCTSSGGLRGEMCLRLPPLSVLRLAQHFTNAPPAPETEVTLEHRDATIELLRQIAGLVAADLKPHWGEVQLRLEPSSGTPSWPASCTLWVRAGEAASPLALVEVHLSAALVAALRAEKNATQESISGAAAAPSEVPSNVKLDLLMNVELAVTLRFGSRRLLLREILDLHPGAVVGLDRQVEEPVDVLLDGRLVARGEVVVMDGNYGLRVTEVAPASP